MCMCVYHIGYDPVDSSSNIFFGLADLDLLRIMWYGFKGFCARFTARHPGSTWHQYVLTSVAH